eukprot:8294483-Karenia_brevis.AAC.1
MEHTGTLDEGQSVPRAEIMAVMRALLVVERTGDGVTQVTIWSDSKIVVDGLKSKTTLQSALGPDWEDVLGQS